MAVALKIFHDIEHQKVAVFYKKTSKLNSFEITNNLLIDKIAMTQICSYSPKNFQRNKEHQKVVDQHVSQKTLNSIVCSYKSFTQR